MNQQNEIICTICQKVYKRQSALTSHVSKMHPIEETKEESK